MIPELPEPIRELFPFEPHWVEATGRQLHYVDEGPRTSSAILLMHGNPTWSFLYRKIIPPLVNAGFRVVAPDFLGSGRSDHGVAEEEYAIANHVARTLAVLDHIGVERVVPFLQDWGGPIGLGMELCRPGLIRGAVLGNTFWGEASEFHKRVFPWRTMHAPVAGSLLFSRRPVFIGGLRLGGPDEIQDGPAFDAYRLPYQVHNGSAGATLAWPRAIATGPGHPTQALADAIWEMLPHLDIPVRFVWGDADVVFPPGEQGEAMRARLPRGRDHEMILVPGGKHFVQEFAPDVIARELAAVATEALSAEPAGAPVPGPPAATSSGTTPVPPPPLPVLTDDLVWPEMREAAEGFTPEWSSSSGRRYRVGLDGIRIIIALLRDELCALPGGDEIDDDLLELAGAIQDAAGEPWGSTALKRASIAYGWHGRPFATGPAD